MTVNECHNLHRSFWKRKTQLKEMENSEKSSLPEDKIDLQDALQKLPAEYRVIIHMYYYEGYKTKEITEILQIKEATVRTRLARGRERLRELLKEEWAYETE